MQELEVTWGRVLSVWWLLAWRSFVGAFLLAFVAGFVFGIVAKLAGWPADKIQLVCTILGVVIGVIWGFFVLRMALKKRYGGFRIALVPAAET